jgi:hypothetical protein
VAGVVDTLKAAGKLDNTLIIYTSDNGYAVGDHRQFGKNAESRRSESLSWCADLAFLTMKRGASSSTISTLPPRSSRSQAYRQASLPTAAR